MGSTHQGPLMKRRSSLKVPPLSSAMHKQDVALPLSTGPELMPTLVAPLPEGEAEGEKGGFWAKPKLGNLCSAPVGTGARHPFGTQSNIDAEDAWTPVSLTRSSKGGPIS